MRPIGELPFDTWLWLAIASVFGTLAFKSWTNWKKQKNEVSGAFVWIGLGAVISYVIWASAPLFLNNDYVRYMTTAGDIFIAVPIAVNAYLLWLLVLRERGISKWFPLVLAAGLVVWSTIDILQRSIGNPDYAQVAEDGTLQITSLPHAQSLLFLFFLIPIGAYFLRSGVRASTAIQKTRGFALALVYFGLSAVEIYANSINSVEQSQEGERLFLFGTMIVFGLLFFVMARISRKK